MLVAAIEDSLPDLLRGGTPTLVIDTCNSVTCARLSSIGPNLPSNCLQLVRIFSIGSLVSFINGPMLETGAYNCQVVYICNFSSLFLPLAGTPAEEDAWFWAIDSLKEASFLLGGIPILLGCLHSSNAGDGFIHHLKLLRLSGVRLPPNR